MKSIKFLLAAGLCLFFGNARPSEEQLEQSHFANDLAQLEPKTPKKDTSFGPTRRKNTFIRNLESACAVFEAGATLFDKLSTFVPAHREVNYMAKNYGVFKGITIDEDGMWSETLKERYIPKTAEGRAATLKAIVLNTKISGPAGTKIESKPGANPLQTTHMDANLPEIRSLANEFLASDFDDVQRVGAVMAYLRSQKICGEMILDEIAPSFEITSLATSSVCKEAQPIVKKHAPEIILSQILWKQFFTHILARSKSGENHESINSFKSPDDDTFIEGMAPFGNSFSEIAERYESFINQIKSELEKQPSTKSQPTVTIGKQPKPAKKKPSQKQHNREPHKKYRSHHYFDEQEESEEEEVTLEPEQPRWFESFRSQRKPEPSKLLLKFSPRVYKKIQEKMNNPKPNNTDLVDHTPTTLLFRYMTKLGIKTPYANKTHEGQVDDSYAIPGEIHYANGQHAIGVFTACIAKSCPGFGICYHWGFNRKPNDKLISEYTQNGRWKIEKIEEQPKDSRRLFLPATDDEAKVTDETNQTVTIDDPHNGSQIILYKMKT